MTVAKVIKMLQEQDQEEEIFVSCQREITTRIWQERLEKHIKRANVSFECYMKWNDTDDLDRLITDANAILETAKQTKRAIKFMNIHGIE